MPLGKEIGLGPGHIVLDGDPAPTAASPHFRPRPIVTKWSPISATAEFLFNSAVYDKSDIPSVVKSAGLCVRALATQLLQLCSGRFSLPPWSITEPLQQVLNAAARLVVGLKPFDSVTPALKQLYPSNTVSNTNCACLCT